MFLMNIQPSVALQTQWRSFTLSNCNLPVCFSESEEEISGISVHAKVQMIIDSLKSEESSIDMNNEYENVIKKKVVADKYDSCIKKGDSPVVNKGIILEHASCDLPTNLDEDECSELGPLVLDSDSDDSVDRDIEEAIQEYLRTKTKSDSLSDNSRCNAVRKEQVFKKTSAQIKLGKSTVPSVLLQTNNGATAKSYTCLEAKPGRKSGCSSPSSVSSDDSFEQSIQAEIEQFLQNKRHKEANNDFKTSTAQVNKAILSRQSGQKLAPLKPRCQTKRGADRKHSVVNQGGTTCAAAEELWKSSIQPDESKPAIRTEKVKELNHTHFKKLVRSRYAASVCGEKKAHQSCSTSSNTVKPLNGTKASSVEELSDSSSDDGIEEAIQLYQRERRAKKVCDSAVSSADLQVKHTLCKGSKQACLEGGGYTAEVLSIEEQHESPSKKREFCCTSSSEETPACCEASSDSRKQKDDGSSPLGKVAVYEPAAEVPCRADTSAELMCAEAILDISKTVISALENEQKMLPFGTFHKPENVPYSLHSDNSSVDSDDGIEQEIRNFLALKAQANTLASRDLEPEKCTSLQEKKKQNNDESYLSGTRKLSLNRKRRLKSSPSRGDEVLKQESAEKKLCIELASASRCTLHCQIRKEVTSCQRTSFLVLRENRAGGEKYSKPSQMDWKSSHSDLLDTTNQETQRQQGRNCMQVKPRLQPKQPGFAVDDKSSSLDSDEDLDSAIKELLRSKKKLKKKAKDTKCKKRVRFGDVRTHFVDKTDENRQKEWSGKSHTTLKSCLSKSKVDYVRTNENERFQNSCNKKIKKEKMESECPSSVCHLNTVQTSATDCFTARTLSGSKIVPAHAPVLSDDSSSVDSDDSIEQEIQKFLAEKARESESKAAVKGHSRALNRLACFDQSTEKTDSFCSQEDESFRAASNQSEVMDDQKTKGSKISSLVLCSGANLRILAEVSDECSTKHTDIHSLSVVKPNIKQKHVDKKGIETLDSVCSTDVQSSICGIKQETNELQCHDVCIKTETVDGQQESCIVKYASKNQNDSAVSVIKSHFKGQNKQLSEATVCLTEQHTTMNILTEVDNVSEAETYKESTLNKACSDANKDYPGTLQTSKYSEGSSCSSQFTVQSVHTASSGEEGICGTGKETSYFCAPLDTKPDLRNFNTPRISVLAKCAAERFQQQEMLAIFPNDQRASQFQGDRLKRSHYNCNEKNESRVEDCELAVHNIGTLHSSSGCSLKHENSCQKVERCEHGLWTSPSLLVQETGFPISESEQKDREYKFNVTLQKECCSQNSEQFCNEPADRIKENCESSQEKEYNTDL
ncbi:protein phosphatase 1 regulatory subunit 26 [Protopterus annectens]|uniref:protein phosphatase 1 regulatory subunit 26 n=1 Tax=Protopterus annectens TaxID=7888 RepID=UPI001CFA7B81|nr:protein phosphatase 1 regulatory subunit 26 [Protopterus annectens]XP_043914385.1 protein phosphatase 1 regulatory subunit 26 [Protopterus annectens]XP_043914386.1 protein phosphatase 1 regulatory subunit 26 [Protopterus annectens]XP_043914387.1 protein phosphatase 1 regulatory subunit 26 [Protopterus annectens]